MKTEYLPMCCPSCGRARLMVWVEDDAIEVQCEKCNATAWDCDDEEHRRSATSGDGHAQHAIRWAAPL